MAQTLVVTQIPVKDTANPGPGEISQHFLRSSEWYKSGSIAYGDTTSINVFELPGNCLVLSAAVLVTTAFSASGDGGDACTMTLTVPNSTGTETIYDAAGTLLQATGGSFASGPLPVIVPASGGYLIAAYTMGATASAGAAEVYVEIVRLEDRLPI